MSVYESNLEASFYASPEELQQAIDEFDALPPHALVRVYHGTTADNAALMKQNPIAGYNPRGDSVSGVSGVHGLYVAPTIKDAGFYTGPDGVVVDFVVPKGSIKASPEARGQSPGWAFFHTYDGAVVDVGTPLQMSAGSSWRALSPGMPWLDYKAVILSDGGPSGRKGYEVYLDGALIATRGSLREAKAVIEDKLGSVEWGVKRLEAEEAVHYYFGPTREFGSPTTIWTVASGTSPAYRGVQFFVNYPDSLEGLHLLAQGSDRGFADWLLSKMVDGSSYDSWTGQPGAPMSSAGRWWTSSKREATSYAGVPGQSYGPSNGNISIPVVMTAEYTYDDNYKNDAWDGSDIGGDRGGFWHLPEGTPLKIVSFEVTTPTRASAQELLDSFGVDVEGDWGSLGSADWYTSEYRTWKLPIPTMQTNAFSKKAGLIHLDLPEGVGAWIVDHDEAWTETPYVSIDKINVREDLRRQGLGTKAMQMICDWADANNKILSLTPANDFGTPLTVLRRWYQSFGFVNNNKGNERFTVGDDLIRFPRGRTASRSGDQHKLCADGEYRWGLYGSAGVLFFCDEQGVRRYFLQHRSPSVDSGGTWGIPGGALNEGEDPAVGAMREFSEEIGFVPRHRVVKVHEEPVAEDWSYTTIVAQVTERFDHELSTWEGDTGGWFTLDELVGLNLHPGFASSLGRVVV